MKKILLVFGTRPEAIKMAPLVNEFKKHPNDFKTIVCVTGQHRQMLDQVLDLFEIVPEYDLNIMKPNQDLYDITSNVLLGIRDVLMEVKPDIVFVHGDTTTSTASALAAFYQQIPVAHVEAGLRTHNMYSPWPEEINRQITSRISTYNFAPTKAAKDNLLKENISAEKIFVTGNTVIDALQFVIKKTNNSNEITLNVKDNLLKSGYNINNISADKKIVLITGHRRENFGDGFLNICNAIKNLATKFRDIDFIYPMHLNPNVRKPVLEILGDKTTNSNIYLIEPLDYLPFVYLMSKSYLLLTDSGGIQEEAPGLGKPVLVMRDTTERPEAVDAGTVFLVGTEVEKIEKYVSILIENNELYLSMSKAQNPYGDGNASKRIVD
ncbi:MAG: non-hydrolyzing UDP-N-acetylglucosamine 2-epimerase, partial [Paludibacter sp.]